MLLLIVSSAFILQGCVHNVVTVPVKVAYTATNGVVQGTGAVTKAIIPGDSKDKDKED
ncbi:NF038104 family lipoprotein [Mycobacterium tuberculosis]|nr:NF038104 family lipoprotein [Mycobacterium tuberculosis]